MGKTATIARERELDLINKAQKGDRQAFGALVYAYREGVVNVVYRMCGDAELAEDAAQDAFIKAWQHLPNYQPRSPFKNWVYRIATNAALDVLRRERETADVDDIPLTAPGRGPEASAERSERAIQVQKAVLALPKSSRAVVILREYEGLTYREIADTLNIPLGTVMSRLNYGRTKLKQALQPYLETL